MPLPIYRLRRLLALTAVLLTLMVAGMYFYARSRAKNVLNSIPGKIGIDIKQTASGFQFSKSDGKRTLFTVQASNLKEFKLNGNAELHNVSIVLYGRDASRYDQIYGDDFAYNQKTGDVTAKGEVQIDLVANPAGLGSPDQSAPRELKNPIHLKTRDLVFNKDSGNAWTDAQVELQTVQASGSAVGVRYAAHSNALTLSSQIHIVLTGANAAVIDAEHGVITNEPRQIILDHPRLTRLGSILQADRATFHLGAENHVENVVAEGNVMAESRAAKPLGSDSAEPPPELHGRADRADFLLADNDRLRTATLSGSVHFDQTGTQAMEGQAGRVVFDFAGKNQLQKIHAVDGAHISQSAANSARPPQGSDLSSFDLTAPVIDFTLAAGHTLKQAITSGPPEIKIAQAEPAKNKNTDGTQQTVVTAGKFIANFALSDGKNHLVAVHGSPNARIINSTQGQPDRVSTSDSIDAAFLPQGGIESITQKGNVAYSDGQHADKQMQASADLGRFTPADQMLVLAGNPRVSSGGMASTANSIRINRATGDAFADGDVKTTYSDLKEQPDGALLASSSPIHVTAQSMVAHNAPAIATYTGNARIWQDANVVEAPSIQFDRDRRSLTAQGTSTRLAKTILIQPAKTTDIPATGKKSSPLGSSPISITAMKLTYADSERKVHYDGGVVAQGTGFTASAKTADAYLLARGQTSATQAPSGPGQLDRMVAQGDVLIQQNHRRAEGQTLVYSTNDDKFVLTGGPPSIFDAEQGKITGVSLTFFRHDDRVLVEGEGSSPVVTTTRVAR